MMKSGITIEGIFKRTNFYFHFLLVSKRQHVYQNAFTV